MRSLSPLASSVVLALVVGCSKPAEPIAERAPDKPAATAAPSSAPATSGASAAQPASASASPAIASGPAEIGYDAPASWVTAPNPNPMRKATFKIPKAGGEPEDAELTVSAASGGVEPNVKRWEGQFGGAKAKTEPRTVNGLKVTVVEIKGTFTGGGPMMGQPAPPKEHQMLLGAVVDGGETQHFFKMVGGEKTVTAARKDFDKLVSSFRAK